jgi:hypothetical protein
LHCHVRCPDTGLSTAAVVLFSRQTPECVPFRTACNERSSHTKHRQNIRRRSVETSTVAELPHLSRMEGSMKLLLKYMRTACFTRGAVAMPSLPPGRFMAVSSPAKMSSHATQTGQLFHPPPTFQYTLSASYLLFGKPASSCEPGQHERSEAFRTFLALLPQG